MLDACCLVRACRCVSTGRRGLEAAQHILPVVECGECQDQASGDRAHQQGARERWGAYGAIGSWLRSHEGHPTQGARRVQAQADPAHWHCCIELPAPGEQLGKTNHWIKSDACLWMVNGHQLWVVQCRSRYHVSRWMAALWALASLVLEAATKRC